MRTLRTSLAALAVALLALLSVAGINEGPDPTQPPPVKWSFSEQQIRAVDPGLRAGIDSGTSCSASEKADARRQCEIRGASGPGRGLLFDVECSKVTGWDSEGRPHVRFNVTCIWIGTPYLYRLQ